MHGLVNLAGGMQDNVVHHAPESADEPTEGKPSRRGFRDRCCCGIQIICTVSAYVSYVAQCLLSVGVLLLFLVFLVFFVLLVLLVLLV